MSTPTPSRTGGLNRPPIVLLPSCQRELERLPFQVVSRKYVEAVRLAGGVPLVVPAALVDELGTLLDAADGVLLTGSPSNVHPSHFGEGVHDPSLPLDPDRDAWTLPLIREALAVRRQVFGEEHRETATSKNELGLDHNETRSWHGWHRHVSLVMLAFAMMAVIRHRANQPPPPKRQVTRMRRP